MNIEHFRQLLIDLESYLNETNAPILEILNPGLSHDRVQNAFASLSLPEEVFVLYEWKNGSVIKDRHTLAKNWLFKMGIFISAKEAFELYNKKVNLDEFWTKNLIPLFKSGGGEFFLIDSNTESPTYRMIFFHSASAVDYDTMISRFDSLETLFATVLECFQLGIYKYNFESKMLDFDTIAERRVAKKYNIKADFYKLA